MWGGGSAPGVGPCGGEGEGEGQVGRRDAMQPEDSQPSLWGALVGGGLQSWGSSFMDLDLSIFGGAGGLLVLRLPGPQHVETEGGVMELPFHPRSGGGHHW